MGIEVSVREIKASDLNRAEIDAEYADREEWNDVPEGEQEVYYSHRGHRVFLHLVDASGKPVVWDADEAGFAALLPIQAEVNAALVEAGAGSAELGWGFSAYTFCDCPCSPGFLVQGAGPEKQATVTVVVPATAQAA